MNVAACGTLVSFSWEILERHLASGTAPMKTYIRLGLLLQPLGHHKLLVSVWCVHGAVKASTPAPSRALDTPLTYHGHDEEMSGDAAGETSSRQSTRRRTVSFSFVFAL